MDFWMFRCSDFRMSEHPFLVMAVLEHKKLEVWQTSMDFVVKVYDLFVQFPSEEKFGLVSQLRRAAVSIPSNIAEGCSRNNPKETIQYLYFSLGSLSEVETQLILSERLGFIRLEEKIIQMIVEIRNMLYGVIRFLSKEKSENPKII